MTRISRRVLAEHHLAFHRPRAGYIGVSPTARQRAAAPAPAAVAAAAADGAACCVLVVVVLLRAASGGGGGGGACCRCLPACLPPLPTASTPRKALFRNKKARLSLRSYLKRRTAADPPPGDLPEL